MIWQLSPTRSIDLSTPCLMAILNITPDSFSDGGEIQTPGQAAAAAELAVAAGATVLDLGGESTRPGSEPVPPDVQMQRVVPAIMAIRSRLKNTAITVDTTSAEVAEASLEAGADAVNDTSAGLDDAAMLPLVARLARGVVLMHRPRRAREDRYSDRYEAAPVYGDVVGEVAAFLEQRADAALAAGVPRAGIVLDPGLGFGKSVEQNIELIRGTGRLCELGYPALSGLSRKSFVGRVTLKRDSEPRERVMGSVGLSVVHYLAGARVFRVHDVREHAEALRAAAAAG